MLHFFFLVINLDHFLFVFFLGFFFFIYILAKLNFEPDIVNEITMSF